MRTNQDCVKGGRLADSFVSWPPVVQYGAWCLVAAPKMMMMMMMITRKLEWLIAMFTYVPELYVLRAYQPMFTRVKLRSRIITSTSIVYMNSSPTFIAADYQDQCQHSVTHTCSSLTPRFSNLYSSVVNVFFARITFIILRIIYDPKTHYVSLEYGRILSVQRHSASPAMNLVLASVRQYTPLCCNYTYTGRKEKMQNHSLNTTLSVCKLATCFGYI